MTVSFSVSRAEFDELAKSGTITLTRTYGTHWKKRLKEELGLEINGIKGQDKTYNFPEDPTSTENPIVCKACVNPTEDHGYVQLNAIRVYQKEGSSKIILEITITWSDALNTHLDIADATDDIRKWFRDNLWFYVITGLAFFAVLFIVIKLLGA